MSANDKESIKRKVEKDTKEDTILKVKEKNEVKEGEEDEKC